jgi:hypothetical protein
VGFWRTHVVPRLADIGLAEKRTGEFRERVCSGLTGEVVEVGFGSGLNAAQVGDGFEHHAVGRTVLGGQIEQDGIHARVGQVGSDLRTHDTGAEDGSTAYKQFLRHVSQPIDLK